MKKEKTVKKSAKFNASIEDVWKALTNPEMTKQYMFGCELISSWEAGSEINWVADGKLLVKGTVLEVTPKKLLRYTIFDPNMGLKDMPSNYLTVTYELFSESDQTMLKITQGDFDGIEDAEKRYSDTVAGWDHAIEGLKKLLDS